MCISVKYYVCVKFGCKNASGYGHLGKIAQGSFLWDTLYIASALQTAAASASCSDE